MERDPYTVRTSDGPRGRSVLRNKDEEDTMQGYCLKCREKREIKDLQAVTLKNGRAARQGTCAVCGTKITVMGADKTAKA
jgi:hypothetical protein